MAVNYNAEIAKHMNSFFVNRDKLASKIHPSEVALILKDYKLHFEEHMDTVHIKDVGGGPEGFTNFSKNIL